MNKAADEPFLRDTEENCVRDQRDVLCYVLIGDSQTLYEERRDVHHACERETGNGLIQYTWFGDGNQSCMKHQILQPQDREYEERI